VRFLVSEIRNAGRLEQNESLDPASILGNPPEFVSFGYPLKVKASAMMTSTDVVVTGHVSTKMRFTCGRCLESYEKPYEADFQQVFSSDLKEIDLANDIQEVVYIDLPINPVCREDCKGLCPVCGKNRNELACKCKDTESDPRWAALNSRSYHGQSKKETSTDAARHAPVRELQTDRGQPLDLHPMRQGNPSAPRLPLLRFL
jgi:uncharacterized protein